MDEVRRHIEHRALEDAVGEGRGVAVAADDGPGACRQRQRDGDRRQTVVVADAGGAGDVDADPGQRQRQESLGAANVKSQRRFGLHGDLGAGGVADGTGHDAIRRTGLFGGAVVVADLAGIDDAVAAVCGHAARAAGVDLDVAVIVAVVADIGAIDDAVAAVGGHADRAAGVDLDVAVVGAVVAALVAIDDAVAAAGGHAGRAAGVGGGVAVGVAVVAALVAIDDAVAAAGGHTGRPAGVGGGVAVVIAVVALLKAADDTIAADIIAGDELDDAPRDHLGSRRRGHLSAEDGGLDARREVDIPDAKGHIDDDVVGAVDREGDLVRRGLCRHDGDLDDVIVLLQERDPGLAGALDGIELAGIGLNRLAGGNPHRRRHRGPRRHTGHRVEARLSRGTSTVTIAPSSVMPSLSLSAVAKMAWAPAGTPRMTKAPLASLRALRLKPTNSTRASATTSPSAPRT